MTKLAYIMRLREREREPRQSFLSFFFLQPQPENTLEEEEKMLKYQK